MFMKMKFYNLFFTHLLLGQNYKNHVQMFFGLQLIRIKVLFLKQFSVNWAFVINRQIFFNLLSPDVA